MALALKAELPPQTQLLNRYQLVVEAIDATTGDPVTGVVVSAFTIYADQAEAFGASLDIGPFRLMPGPGA
jgi:hypothetical protein